MRTHAAIGTTILFALGTLACGGDEGADQRGTRSQPAPRAQQQQQQIEVSDEELRAFAEATRELQDVAEQARSDMKGAQGQQETRQIRDDFRETRARIVQEAGLDTARYTEIRQAIESNSDLRQRFLDVQQAEQE